MEVTSNIIALVTSVISLMVAVLGLVQSRRTRRQVSDTESKRTKSNEAFDILLNLVGIVLIGLVLLITPFVMQIIFRYFVGVLGEMK